MLQNKKFQNNDTQEIVNIIGDNGVFYSLSNGSNIKKDIFFQKYSEMVDPSVFFQSNNTNELSYLAEKIKNLDPSKSMDGDVGIKIKYREEPVSEKLTPPPGYRELMLKNYEFQKNNNINISDYKVYDNDEDAVLDFEKRLQQKESPKQSRPNINQNYNNEDAIIKDNSVPVNEYSTEEKNNQPYISQEEESFRFFRSFKKIYPIILSIDFEEKIADPNFIKLMATNYEGDIIKFYTKEFMKRIYNDPGFLENKIYDKLKSIVFEEVENKNENEKIKKTSKTNIKKNPKTNVKKNPKINQDNNG